MNKTPTQKQEEDRLKAYVGNTMKEKMLIECYNGYGRITIKFIEKNSMFENQWVLSEFVKKLECIEEIEKDDDEKDYGAKITFKKGRILNWSQTISKEESREMWEYLQEEGFKPTKETQKLLKRMKENK